jgi:hypothetical protein
MTASIQGTKKRRRPGNHLTTSLPIPPGRRSSESQIVPAKRKTRKAIWVSVVLGVDDKGRVKRSESDVPDRAFMFFPREDCCGPEDLSPPDTSYSIDATLSVQDSSGQQGDLINLRQERWKRSHALRSPWFGVQDERRVMGRRCPRTKRKAKLASRRSAKRTWRSNDQHLLKATQCVERGEP